VDEIGPGLVLYDEHGTVSVTLDVNEDVPYLSMKDNKGNHRVGLFTSDVGSELCLLDDKGTIVWSTPTSEEEEENEQSA
jgi:hypothetical protein